MSCPKTQQQKNVPILGGEKHEISLKTGTKLGLNPQDGSGIAKYNVLTIAPRPSLTNDKEQRNPKNLNTFTRLELNDVERCFLGKEQQVIITTLTKCTSYLRGQNNANLFSPCLRSLSHYTPNLSFPWQQCSSPWRSSNENKIPGALLASPCSSITWS